jgi:hypothetical protein
MGEILQKKKLFTHDLYMGSYLKDFTEVNMIIDEGHMLEA